MDVKQLLLDNGYDEVEYFRDFQYDTAIIGVTSDFRAVYDYNLMVKWLMNNENFTEEEAIDWITYNIERALPLMGKNAPIIMYRLIY